MSYSTYIHIDINGKDQNYNKLRYKLRYSQWMYQIILPSNVSLKKRSVLCGRSGRLGLFRITTDMEKAHRM